MFFKVILFKTKKRKKKKKEEKKKKKKKNKSGKKKKNKSGIGILINFLYFHHVRLIQIESRVHT